MGVKKTDLNDHTFYAYCLQQVTTNYAKIVVVSHYSKANNGAEEIGFLLSGGKCVGSMKEKGGKFTSPTIPDGEIPASNKAKCSARCHATAACKAWNFNKL